ncbi:hypothetical protein M758_UG283900 [Ceratodon purpureus]|nr:hypothetical protein M758_UG283900 [Ceratodon purpureus]
MQPWSNVLPYSENGTAQNGGANPMEYMYGGYYPHPVPQSMPTHLQIGMRFLSPGGVPDMQKPFLDSQKSKRDAGSSNTGNSLTSEDGLRGSHGPLGMPYYFPSGL